MDEKISVRLSRGLFLACTLSLSFPVCAEWIRFGPENHVAELDKSIQEFNNSRDDLLKNKGGVLNYIQAGLTISNISCDAWLVSLGRTDRDTSFFKNVLNIVGNLILGVSGINGANSSSLARGSLALSASNATIDAYRNDFLMGVASDIEVKVKGGRMISAKILLNDMPTNYQEAKRRLMEYHDQCTPTAIKELLKTSLAQVAYAPPETTMKSEVNEARASLLAVQLYAAMYPAGQAPYTITTDDLYKLWVVTIALPVEHPSTLAKGYKAASDVVALKGTFDSKNTSGQLVPLLKQVAEYRGFAMRLDKELAREKQEAAAVQEAELQRKLDDSIKEVKKSEQEVKDLEREVLDLQSSLEVQVESSNPAVRKGFSDFIGSINSFLGSRKSIDLTGVDSMMQAPLALNQSELSKAARDLRDKLARLALKREEVEAAREREKIQQSAWDRALMKRSDVVKTNGLISITPVIIPVHR